MISGGGCHSCAKSLDHSERKRMLSRRSEEMDLRRRKRMEGKWWNRTSSVDGTAQSGEKVRLRAMIVAAVDVGLEHWLEMFDFI